jgi:hypothetical protein
MTPAAVMALQRSVGNRAVSRMIAADASRSGGLGTTAIQRVQQQGTYGYRRDERRFLEDEYDEPIDGNRTHQSEHTYGYAAMTSRSGGRRGGSTEMRAIEDRLPAYYETHRAHRDHVGTGSGRRRDPASGLTPQEYRDAQYTAASRDDPFTGVAMNQIGYAHQSSWHAQTGTTAGRQADDSFRRMVRSGAPVEYYSAPGQSHRTRPLTRQEQADLEAARRTMRDRAYISAEEERALAEAYGLRRERSTRSGRRY